MTDHTTGNEQNHNDYCWSFCVEHGRRLLDCDCPCHETESGERHVEREWWTRNVRGMSAKPGQWHLVKQRAHRSYPWSAGAECGFHPDHGHQRCDDRPTQGKFCAKCLRAAETRATSPGKGSDS